MDRSPAPTSPSPARPPTRLAFHATRIVVDLGVLVALGSMSLPFVTSEVSERSAVTADALPALLLLVPIFLITLLPDHTRPLPLPLGWLAMVLGATAFPYAIVKFLDASNVAETIGGTVGLGARLLVLGTFITLIGIGLGLLRGLLKLPTGGAVPGPRPVPSYPEPSAAARRLAREGDPAAARRGTGPAPRPAPRPGPAAGRAPSPSPHPPLAAKATPPPPPR